MNKIETGDMVLKLTGEYRPKFIKAAGDGFKVGELACELAESAILAERCRCIEAVNYGFREHGGETALMDTILAQMGCDPK